MGIEGKSFLDQTSLVVNSTPKTAQFVFASATFSKEDLFKVIKLGCIKPSTLFLDLLPRPLHIALQLLTRLHADVQFMRASRDEMISNKTRIAFHLCSKDDAKKNSEYSNNFSGFIEKTTDVFAKKLKRTDRDYPKMKTLYALAYNHSFLGRSEKRRPVLVFCSTSALAEQAAMVINAALSAPGVVDSKGQAFPPDYAVVVRNTLPDKGESLVKKKSAEG